MYRYAFLLITLLLFVPITQAQSVDLPEELEGVQIVFEGIDIYNIDGSNHIPVMHMPEIYQRNEFPVWSPDGQSLAFSAVSRHVFNRADLYIVDADGSNPRQLTNSTQEYYVYIRWSPDGKWFAYDTNNGVGVFNITEQEEVIYMQGWLDSWHHDSKHILVVNNANDITRAVLLNILDQSETVIVAENATAKFTFPILSPDANQYLYTYGEDDQQQLYIVDINGLNRQQIHTNQEHILHASWSPDSIRIAFLSTREENYALYTINMDGTELTKLAEGISDRGIDNDRNGPEWSPDGRYIAFVGDYTIDLVDTETGDRIPLLYYNSYDATFRSVREIRWHPSSRGLLVDLNYNNVNLDEAPWLLTNLTEFRWVDLKCLDTEIGCTPETIEELVIPSPIPESEDYSISPFTTNN